MLMAADFIIAYGQAGGVYADAGVEGAHGECVPRAHKDHDQTKTAKCDGCKDDNDVYLCVCNGEFGHAVHLPGGGCSLPRTAVAVAGAGGGLVRVDVAAALLRCAGKTVRTCGAAGARCRARRPWQCAWWTVSANCGGRGGNDGGGGAGRAQQGVRHA